MSKSADPPATGWAEEEAALDIAEALWWVAVSMGRQRLGVDLSSSPRQVDDEQHSLDLISNLLEDRSKIWVLLCTV